MNRMFRISRGPSRLIRVVPILAIIALGPGADEPEATKAPITADEGAALDRISADSLRGHLSFLASDLLEGRDTPSRGLDLAAEYIAAQFRRAGLEPVGDDGYFQTANWVVKAPDAESFTLEIKAGDETYRVRKDQVTISHDGPIDLARLPVVKLASLEEKALEELAADQVEGKAVLVELLHPSQVEPAQRGALNQSRRRIQERMTRLKAKLLVTVDRDPRGGSGLGNGRLVDPENPNRIDFARARPNSLLAMTIHDPKVAKLFDTLNAGPSEATLSLHLDAPQDQPVKVRNVLGLLRGSDPQLKDTYVMVTAHYDHVGIGPAVNGDRIYNGANDDGSGTVSVVELASALATLKPHPRRSLVFVTFFGEEKGLLGSGYYAKHPVVPIEKTVADVNLEQVGRTDDNEGPQVGTASMTGIDYSEVGTIFQKAGEAEGVKLLKHPRNSDGYFGASDNRALAEVGVPAHTVCVAFAYPDYHGARDHWDKVDYVNMAKIDRMVGRGLLMIADSNEPPRWKEDNPKAARYAKAWKARQIEGH